MIVPSTVLRTLRSTPLPLLLYDLDELSAAVRRLTAAFPRYFYPVKCNPHPGVLRTVLEAGAGVSVRSFAEERTVLGMGARPSKVSFTGWGLGPVLMGRLVRHGITVNLDSAREVRTWTALFPSAPFGVRLLAGDDPGYRNAGFAPTEIPRMLERVRRGGAALRGVLIHFPHEAETAERLLEDWSFLAALLSERLGEAVEGLEYLNLGGGWPGSYGAARPMEPGEVRAELDRGLLGGLSAIGFRGEVAVEPGRFVAAPCGWWAATVAEVRGDADVSIVRLETPPPLPSNALPYPAALLRRGAGGLEAVEGGQRPCRLVGVGASMWATIRERVELPEPRRGDVVVMGQAGAYLGHALNAWPTGPGVAEIAVGGDGL